MTPEGRAFDRLVAVLTGDAKEFNPEDIMTVRRALTEFGRRGTGSRNQDGYIQQLLLALEGRAHAIETLKHQTKHWESRYESAISTLVVNLSAQPVKFTAEYPTTWPKKESDIFERGQLEDIMTIQQRTGLHSHTTKQVAHLWAQFSDLKFSATWMRPDHETITAFVEWMAEDKEVL